MAYNCKLCVVSLMLEYDTVTLLAARSSHDRFVIWIDKEPRKVSVSTDVEGRERVRLARIELMEEVLFFCRCRVSGGEASVSRPAAKEAINDSISAVIMWLMMSTKLWHLHTNLDESRRIKSDQIPNPFFYHG